MSLVITDSSNLIILSKLELLDLLIDFYENIIIPQAVYRESVEQGKKFKKMDALFIEKRVDHDKILVKKIKDTARKKEIINNFNIHEGEAEAIILYFEENADLLGTDDYRTIKTCKILKIKYYTTPSFIFLCFNKNKLSKEMSLLKFDKLSKIGWYKKDIIFYFKEKIENKVD